MSDGTRTGEDAAERLRAAETALADAREEQARLWSEVQRLRAERREVEYFERLVAHMEGSASWKLTSPLRTAKRVSLKVQRELEERRG